MHLLARFLLWGSAGAVLLAGLGGAGGYLWFRGSLPATGGERAVPGLGAPAEIARDPDGLVHIRAASPQDAYFALGFAHAQDRLWQMELTRRLGAGRMAEIAGARLLPYDRMARTLGLYERAAASYDCLSPPARTALDAYVRGVNAYLGTREGALPPEFAVAGIAPEPWRPADSLVWGRLMGLRLSENWRDEALRAALADRLPEDRIRALWPADPDGAPATVSGAGQRALDKRLAPLFRALADAVPAPPAPRTASNAWAVAGRHTASGRPVLANDPHLRFSLPNFWYLARLDAPGLTLAGATAPGVPFHVLGHNRTIAWGMTTTGADTQDLFIETVDPDDRSRYLAPGGPRPFDTRTETIRVRWGDPVTLTVRETRHGPVVSDLADDRHAIDAPEGKVVALAATALARDDCTAEALYRLNRARSWRQFTEALQGFASPVQNFIYADRAGHIGFQTAGRVPVRRAGDGFAPVPGADRAHDWTGVIPFDGLPRLFDPPSGRIVNANNRVAGPGYPHFLSRDWEAPYRARRIAQVLPGTTPHDAAASRALQLDTVSLAARELVPLLLERMPGTPTEGTAIAEALRRLAAWDGRMDRGRAEPLIFTAWLAAINRALYADELGAAFDRFWRLRPRFVRHVLTSDPAWCDDARTPAREFCGPLLLGTLAKALGGIADQFGDDMDNWRWGMAHAARFRNRSLDWLPLLGPLANQTIATPGGDYAVNRGTSRARGPARHDHVHGATLRAVYDLADLDRSTFIQPAGQSGNPFSPHYRDLTRRWRDGAGLTLGPAPRAPARRLQLVPHGTAPE